MTFYNMSGPSSGSSCSTSPQTAGTSPTIHFSNPSRGSSAQHGRASQASSPYSSWPGSSPEYVSPYPPLPTTSAGRPITAITPTRITRAQVPESLSATARVADQQGNENVREYTSTASPLQRFQYPAFGNMLGAGSITQAQKQSLIKALNEHRVNTIGELRRVERIFATLGSSDITQPMTSAWVYYVNSNSLLTELRGITKTYPFSSECLEEAKRRVHQDPASNRSWNYCWLVLAKIHTDRLIQTYARAQALRPEMWGGRTPQAESIDQLAQAFVEEWTTGLAQLLKYWESAPIR